MKKLLLVISIAFACIIGVSYYSETYAKVNVIRTNSETFIVKGVKDPTRTGGVALNFTVSWDGSDLYVHGCGGNKYTPPVLATRTYEYSGYPYYVYHKDAKYYLRFE